MLIPYQSCASAEFSRRKRKKLEIKEKLLGKKGKFKLVGWKKLARKKKEKKKTNSREEKENSEKTEVSMASLWENSLMSQC